MIAQLSVYPIGEGTSLGRFVRKGVKVIEESGYTYEIGGMSTAIEVPDLDALFDLVKKVHAAQVEEGVPRDARQVEDVSHCLWPPRIRLVAHVA